MKIDSQDSEITYISIRKNKVVDQFHFYFFDAIYPDRFGFKSDDPLTCSLIFDLHLRSEVQQLKLTFGDNRGDRIGEVCEFNFYPCTW